MLEAAGSAECRWAMPAVEGSQDQGKKTFKGQKNGDGEKSRILIRLLRRNSEKDAF